MRPFISRYPGFLANSPEFCDLQQALEPELLGLWAAWESTLAQLCAETATWGLRYWEETLGIPVDEGKELSARRSRVRVKLLGVDVTTVALVRSSAEIYSGLEAEVVEFPQEFRFEINFGDFQGIPPNLRDLTRSLREILPAHLLWDYHFIYTIEEPVGVGVTAFSEARPQVEVWPHAPQAAQAADPFETIEHHSRFYPAGQENVL